MKIRSDSLYAKLKAAGTLDEFFVWFYAEDPSYDSIHAKLEGWGLSHSDGAIHNLISIHGLQWKVASAQAQSEAVQGLLPKDAQARLREGVRVHEFNLTFSNLTNKEKLSLLRFDQDRRSAEFNAQLETEKLALKREAEARAQESLKLEQEKYRRDTCELFVKWAKDARAMEIANSKGLGSDEKVEKLGQLIFGEDW